jgi:hypothetical protein
MMPSSWVALREEVEEVEEWLAEPRKGKDAQRRKSRRALVVGLGECQKCQTVYCLDWTLRRPWGSSIT